MTTRVVTSEYERAMAGKWVSCLKPPFTMSVTMGKHRTADQNRLAFAWYKEAAEQLGDRTPNEVRAECKLTIGVPIRREDDAFREAYDKLVKPLSYEEKLALMVEPFDLAVTRHMTTKELTRYLDTMQRYYAEQGVILTTPEWADFMEGR